MLLLYLPGSWELRALDICLGPAFVPFTWAQPFLSISTSYQVSLSWLVPGFKFADSKSFVLLQVMEGRPLPIFFSVSRRPFRSPFQISLESAKKEKIKLNILWVNFFDKYLFCF